jgi:hypothetical protein
MVYAQNMFYNLSHNDIAIADKVMNPIVHWGDTTALSQCGDIVLVQVNEEVVSERM